MIGARLILALGASLFFVGFWFRSLASAVDPDQVATTRHRLLKDALRDENSRNLERYDRQMDALKNRLPIYARWLMIAGAVVAAIGGLAELTGLLPSL